MDVDTASEVNRLPSWYQENDGDGWPLAEQVNVAVVSGATTVSEGLSVMMGGRGTPDGGEKWGGSGEGGE